ncbi:MAG: hypothetical protein CVV49_20280, partial [Spirochaetae bacterium HGW-Spirochaetae-5]
GCGSDDSSDLLDSITDPGAALGPAVVDLGGAGNFALLAKTKITVVPVISITGDVGISPAAASLLVGFSETLDSTTDFSTSIYVTGKLYAADYPGTGAGGTPGQTISNLTTAVSNMEAAYTDASTRPTPDSTDLGAAGDIGGLNFVPGLYKFTTAVSMTSNITLSGDSNDVWIFQIDGTFNMSNAVRINLVGGALPQNIFWVSAGAATLGTTAHFEGILLSQTAITFGDGATANGRLLAQSEVTLGITSVVVEP